MTTPYGPGTILPPGPVPAEGGDVRIVPVQLAYGTAYMNEKSVSAAVGVTPEPKPSIEVPSSAAPAPSSPVRKAPTASVTPAPKRSGAAASVTSPAGTGSSSSSSSSVLLPFSSVRVVTQCVVQLELISAVGVLADAHLPSLTYGHVELLLGLLQRSAAFARRFNGDRPLRRALWEAGFMRVAKQANKLPSLLRQEASATQQLLILLMRLYTVEAQKGGLQGQQPEGGSPSLAMMSVDATDGSIAVVGTSEESAGDVATAASSLPAPPPGTTWRDMALHHLASLAKGMVARYTRLAVEVERARMLVTPSYMHGALQLAPSATTSSSTGGAALPSPSIAGSEAPPPSPGATSHLLDGSGQVDRDLFREAAAYGQLVLTLLRELLAFDDTQFKENLDWLYPLLTGLIVAGNIEIRSHLAAVFEGRIGSLLGLTSSSTSSGSGVPSTSSSSVGRSGRLSAAAAELGQLDHH